MFFVHNHVFRVHIVPSSYTEAVAALEDFEVYFKVIQMICVRVVWIKDFTFFFQGPVLPKSIWDYRT